MQNWERFLKTVLGDKYKKPPARGEPKKRNVGQKPEGDREKTNPREHG